MFEPYWTKEKVKETLPERAGDSHKGTFGTGLLIAGSESMPGAALIAGLGAMRCGVGKLVMGTENSVMQMVVPVLPEATYWLNPFDEYTEPLPEVKYKAAAIGPGLPNGEPLESRIDQLINLDFSLILDAGALTKRAYPTRNHPLILTPHPGEFERITGMSVKEQEKDRLSAAKEWSRRLGTVIVLKGKETVIAFPDGDAYLNPTGNSALAKGGSGDTLTGMMLGMLCCHENHKHAVLNAVFLHGACADEWVKTQSPHTMLAHELSGLLPAVWKKYEE
ncbi:NAD(P)H-hydrate dehydratase [Falsibacillus albus]|uniref:ADP-dependent (S)-NAD(P)H-hydrate dehydratase n=1 Tax=Falsibacillus albus TaxID=2478915 RepID=A0A3L7JT75_9BACI|nr:NAD(P)H-hydrate dehydratase [Falsibacillus albus]RLQ94067.1 NAD(P)H-hydrate dehydratase [Falsibacillus albus]